MKPEGIIVVTTEEVAISQILSNRQLVPSLSTANTPPSKIEFTSTKFRYNTDLDRQIAVDRYPIKSVGFQFYPVRNKPVNM